MKMYMFTEHLLTFLKLMGNNIVTRINTGH